VRTALAHLFHTKKIKRRRMVVIDMLNEKHNIFHFDVSYVGRA
jgi:hypothetical protein